MAIVDGKIRCPSCSEWKELGAFQPKAAAKGSGKCLPCLAAYQREWQRKNRESRRASSLRWWAKKSPEERADYRIKRNYGISRREYDQLLVVQRGVCAICAQPPRPGKWGRLYVDHDHESGVVRGLLCHYCNSGIGMFEDDGRRLRAALDYLERAEGVAAPPVRPVTRINLLPGAN